jgi:hypothetical protein
MQLYKSLGIVRSAACEYLGNAIDAEGDDQGFLL